MKEKTMVFLNTWGLYNMSYEPTGEIGKENGFIGYGWMTPEQAREFIEQNPGRDGGEWFVADIDNYTGVQFRDLNECNAMEVIEILEALENMDKYDKEVVAVLLNEGYTLEEAIEKKDDCMIYSNCDDMEDVARQYAEETGLLGSMPEELQYYFDFAAFGRDMDYNGHYVFAESGNCVQIL